MNEAECLGSWTDGAVGDELDAERRTTAASKATFLARVKYEQNSFKPGLAGKERLILSRFELLRPTPQEPNI